MLAGGGSASRRVGVSVHAFVCRVSLWIVPHHLRPCSPPTPFPLSCLGSYQLTTPDNMVARVRPVLPPPPCRRPALIHNGTSGVGVLAAVAALTNSDREDEDREGVRPPWIAHDQGLSLPGAQTWAYC